MSEDPTTVLRFELEGKFRFQDSNLNALVCIQRCAQGFGAPLRLEVRC